MNNHAETAKQLIEIIEIHFKEISTIDWICRQLNCNYHTLRADFSRAYGMPIKKYLIIVRCEKSKLYLKNTDWKLYIIAREVGFGNEKYFIRIFKKLNGVCPSAFRKKHI